MFYVYEWVRADLNLPYYIGKGHGARAYSLTRNKHTNKVTNYLISTGIRRDVRIIAYFSTEEAALEFEIERIAFWWYLKEHDILTNQSLGGRGLPKGYKHTPEAIQNMSAAQKIIQKRPEIVEAKRCRMLGNLSRTGMKDSAETIERKRQGVKAARGKPESREKSSRASKIMHSDPDFKLKHKKSCKDAANRPNNIERLKKLIGENSQVAKAVVELSEMRVFPTIKSASIHYNVKNIYAVLVGKQKTTGGRRFALLSSFSEEIQKRLLDNKADR